MISPEETRLVVHHVGGRAGIRSFPVIPAFDEDYINVMYDADTNCLEDMVEYSKAQPSQTMVLPYCISGHEGSSKFHLNYDPFTSSIYPLNPRYAEFYGPSHEYDYVLGDTLRTMKEVQLPTTTLDSLALDLREVPAPDFLSLDTQGNEYDILTGASILLDENILAVQAEVSFHPLYKGTPLFGQICELLAQHNFDLVDIPYPFIGQFYPIRGRQGFRGQSYVMQAEAVFLKRPETLDPNTKAIQLKKLAFIATILGRFECAEQCFKSLDFDLTTTPNQKDGNKQPRYLDFISRLAHAVSLLPERSVASFNDIYTYDESQTLQAWNPSLPRSQKSFFRKMARTIPFAVPIIKALRGLPLKLKSTRIRAHWRFKYPDSPVEALFLEYGMKELYLLAKRNRFLDSQNRQTRRMVAGILKDLTIH